MTHYARTIMMAMRKQKRPSRPDQALGGKAKRVSPRLLEADRENLLRRLASLNDSVKQRPGYKSALSLLNARFRKSSLSARIAILQAASFMIDVLERIPPFT